LEVTVDVVTPTRSTYAAAWAILFGSLLVLVAGAVWATIDGAHVEALLGLSIGFMALQVIVFTVLVGVESRTLRVYWGMAVPMSIVAARVVAGLTGVLVGTKADATEVAYADILF
jgi:hypothetical protein